MTGDQLVRTVAAVAADRVGAPARRARATACSGETPIIVWPRVSNVIVVMSGDPGRDPADALDGGLDLDQVGHRLDPDQVDATGHERRRLLGEDVDRLVVARGSRSAP